MSDAISPEQLITNLTYENKKLKDELRQAESNLEEFEHLAIEWKDGYNKREHQLKVKITHLEQTIEELKDEIDELQELT